MDLNTIIQFSLLLLYHVIRALGFVILLLPSGLFRFNTQHALLLPLYLAHHLACYETWLGYSPAPSSIHSMHCCSLSTLSQAGARG